jgi:hypothetical protein
LPGVPDQRSRIPRKGLALPTTFNPFREVVMVKHIQPSPDVDVVEVPFQRETLERLDAWIAEQPEEMDRATAVRAIVVASLE